MPGKLVKKILEEFKDNEEEKNLSLIDQNICRLELEMPEICNISLSKLVCHLIRVYFIFSDS